MWKSAVSTDVDDYDDEYEDEYEDDGEHETVAESEAGETEKWEQLKLLGSGNYGDVYEVVHRQTRVRGAMKRFKANEVTSRQLNDLFDVLFQLTLGTYRLIVGW
jgi:serine/threonine protein kinase